MYRCKKCDSTNVEEKMWVNMNHMTISDNYHTDCDLDDELNHYCIDCESITIIIDDEEQ